ncbi:MAG TPA: hypothetical protein VIQ60_14540 [Gemmatimonadaceae bacterium]
MHPDLAALLALQEDDTAVAALEARLDELGERTEALDRERSLAGAAIERIRTGAETEERKRRDLALKVQEHKSLQERNLATLDVVRKAREAQAAMTQVDMARRVLVQEESDLQVLTTRLAELSKEAELHVRELEEVDRRQVDERKAIARSRREIENELVAVRAKRETSASRVPRATLAKYERIRRHEKSHALYQLRGTACGRCNTAIPLQRRNIMAEGRSVEVCEGCGVLLYAPA